MSVHGVPPRPAPGWLEALEPFAAEFFARHGVPGGALSVVVDGVTEFQFSYGKRDRERGLPVEADTRFGIASLTKSVTALTLLALEARGVLSLRDEVTRYLPAFDYPGIGADGPVRLEHLASHTSGLPPVRGLDYAIRPSQVGDPSQAFNQRDYTGAPAIDDHDSLLAYLAEGERRALPGPGRLVSYSNEGFALLGAVIEAATGEPFPAVVDREVLGPLGMRSAGFDTAAAAASGKLTELYTRAPADPGGCAGEVIHSPRWEEAPAYLATGFLKASSEDLAAYVGFLAAPKAGKLGVDPARLRALFTPRGWAEHLTGYGLGWMLRDGYRGLRIWRHGGSLKGVSAHQGGVSEARLGVAVLANLDEVPVKRLFHAVLNAYLGLPPDSPPFAVEPGATRLGEGTARRLEGLYDSGEPWGRLELMRRGERLLALVGEDATENGYVALVGGNEFVLVGNDGGWESGRFVMADDGAAASASEGAEPIAVQYGMRWYDRRAGADRPATTQ